MGWADSYIERLKNGETVEFRPHGRSMEPIIKSGQLVKVEPIGIFCPDFMEQEGKRDIVLCTVKGNQYLHLLTNANDDWQFKIENNKGFVNGWIGLNKIYGRVIEIDGKPYKRTLWDKTSDDHIARKWKHKS